VSIGQEALFASAKAFAMKVHARSTKGEELLKGTSEIPLLIC
jgi:hypothetical protein